MEQNLLIDSVLVSVKIWMENMNFEGSRTIDDDEIKIGDDDANDEFGMGDDTDDDDDDEFWTVDDDIEDDCWWDPGHDYKAHFGREAWDELLQARFARHRNIVLRE